MGVQFEKPEKSGKTLLLHSCCGPCSTACIEALKPYFEITVYYYNPNITDQEEYEKRKNEQIKFLLSYAPEIKFIQGDYDRESFFKVAKGLEGEKEGGARCKECIKLRLERTFEFAQKGGYDYFASTLSVSPHKDNVFINEVGEKLSKNSSVSYLATDFKKNGGFARSVELSKQFGLYRQNYCGCIYSKNNLK